MRAVAQDLNVSEREVRRWNRACRARHRLRCAARPGRRHARRAGRVLMANDEDPSQAYERADSEDNQLDLLRRRSRPPRRPSRGHHQAPLARCGQQGHAAGTRGRIGVSAERIRQVEANALKKCGRCSRVSARQSMQRTARMSGPFLFRLTDSGLSPTRFARCAGRSVRPSPSRAARRRGAEADQKKHVRDHQKAHRENPKAEAVQVDDGARRPIVARLP